MQQGPPRFLSVLLISSSSRERAWKSWRCAVCHHRPLLCPIMVRYGNPSGLFLRRSLFVWYRRAFLSSACSFLYFGPDASCHIRLRLARPSRSSVKPKMMNKVIEEEEDSTPIAEDLFKNCLTRSRRWATPQSRVRRTWKKAATSTVNAAKDAKQELPSAARS